MGELAGNLNKIIINVGFDSFQDICRFLLCDCLFVGPLLTIECDRFYVFSRSHIAWPWLVLLK